MVNFSATALGLSPRSGDADKTADTNGSDDEQSEIIKNDENPFEMENEEGDKAKANQATNDEDGVEELFFVDIPPPEDQEIEPPAWMTTTNTQNSKNVSSAGGRSSPPPDSAFNFHREHPSDIGEADSSAPSSSNSSQQRRKSKRKSKKRAVEDQTVLTMASSASSANPDGTSRRHLDDREAMLQAIEGTSSRSMSIGGNSVDGSSVFSSQSGRSNSSSKKKKKRRSKMSTDRTVLPSPDGEGEGGHISSDGAVSAQEIFAMSERGEQFSEVQIHDPDAAAGVNRLESFGRGGRKSSRAGEMLAVCNDIVGDDGLKAPSQGDVSGTTRQRNNTKRSRQKQATYRSQRNQEYDGLALDDRTAAIAEELHCGWGRNEINTGVGATDAPSPEMVAAAGMSSSEQRRSSSIGSTSAAIDAIKKLGTNLRSSISRSSGKDSSYLQIDVERGNAVLGHSKSSSPSSRGGSSNGTDTMEDAVAKYIFEDSEVKDYDTAKAEITAKRKQRERLNRNEWGDGSRRTSYSHPSDGFYEEDDGSVRRGSAQSLSSGPVTSWSFIANKYVPRASFVKVQAQSKKKRNLDDDDQIIDDEDLNDNNGRPRGYGDLDVMGWSRPSHGDRKKKRQRIFWITTSTAIALAVVIGVALVLIGRRETPQGGDISTAVDSTSSVRPDGDRPSNPEDTPKTKASAPARPNPLGPSPPPPKKDASDGPGTLGGKHMFTDSDIQNLLATVTPESVLSNPTSPQYEAMQWILDDLDTSIIYVSESGTTDRILQRYILAVIYQSTGGPWGSWQTDELWLTEEDECSWFGVRCGVNGENVERLLESLGAGIANTTNSDISSYVTYLDLSKNGLEGVLPDEIGSLSKLTEFLAFDNNIGGRLPDSLTNLRELHTLYLGRNRFTGSISNSIGQLTKMKNFDVSKNKLSSSIPNGFGNLRDLVDLRLSENDLSGEFPLEIANLDGLVTLLANDNSIGGTLPEAMGRQLQHLIVVRLHNNELFGDIPIFESPKLEELHLGNNAFDGTIAVPKSKLLRKLYLGKNLLRGQIPSAIAEMTPILEVLDLSFNDISGDIPSSSLEKLISIQEIHINGNSALKGSVDSVCDTLDNKNDLTMRVDLSSVSCKCCECC